jgi:hypothetical protein
MSLSGSPEYAIAELRDLLQRADIEAGVRDLTMRYVCALFAELAYCHIPQWEMDGQHRAKVIPCEAYETLRRRGLATNVLGVLAQLDFGEAFVAEDRGVIAVGVRFNDLVFIGFRGTAFLYDWKINLRSRLMSVDHRFYYVGGRVHVGFAEEALRISLKVGDILREKGLEDRRIFLSGHSLGGAVAALARNSTSLWGGTTCIFGAPRYADLTAYAVFPGPPPLHVRRPEDLVPAVPPRRRGYVDHPYDFRTSGEPFFQLKSRRAWLVDARTWGRFVRRKFAAHGMETYRAEVGEAAGSSAAGLPLTRLRAPVI